MERWVRDVRLDPSMLTDLCGPNPWPDVRNQSTLGESVLNLLKEALASPHVHVTLMQGRSMGWLVVE